jgi:hypothetical protein
MNVVWRAAEIKKLIGEITYYSCVILDDVEYSVDDGVYMWSGKEDSPYIGQISMLIDIYLLNTINTKIKLITVDINLQIFKHYYAVNWRLIISYFS